jgi:RHS repeat-associated protein
MIFSPNLTSTPIPSKFTGYFYAKKCEYRFSFNGQEQDNEIAGDGNIMTAEFWEYDTRLGRRWNVDPITYSCQSSYTTFNNNPVIFVDPLGLFGSRKEAREFKKEHNIKGGRIRINKDGYYSINTKNSTTYRDQENGNVETAALITAKRKDSKSLTPFQLGEEWLTGGPKSRDFTTGDNTVELYKQHEHYRNAIIDVQNKLRNLKPGEPMPDFGFPYKLSGIEGVGKYIMDYSTLATGGTTGNIMFTYLGSHSLWIEVTSNDVSQKVATVTFTVHNTSTLGSATRLPYFGYKEWYQNNVDEFMNGTIAGRTGPTSETEQVFQWSIPIKY